MRPPKIGLCCYGIRGAESVLYEWKNVKQKKTMEARTLPCAIERIEEIERSLP